MFSPQRLSTIRKFLPALILVLAVAARLIPGPRTIDDAFITFRYARNLLSGDGFAFNPGERVQGTTTPFYTMILAGLGSISGGAQAPFPILAWIINAAADGLTCVLLWRIGRRLGSERAGLAAALVWAVAPFSVTFAIGGLETSVYVLLLVGASWAYLEGKYTLCAGTAALAILTRPDAVLLAGLLILDRLYRGLIRRPQNNPAEKLHWQEVLAFSLPLAAWAIFATLYFGSPFAHSVTAKLVAYRLEPNSALIRLIQHYATPFQEDNWLGVAAIGVGIFLYPFLALTGSLKAFRFERRSWALLVFPWVYFLAFSIPNPLIFRWYLTPPMPFYFLAILTGLEQFILNISAGPKKAAAGAAAIPAAMGRPGVLGSVLMIVFVFVLPAAFSLSDWRIHTDLGRASLAPGMAFIQLEQLYAQAAEEIQPYLQPGQTLAAGDVGVLGYVTQARILDTVGLNSAVSLNYYPLDPQAYVINYAIPSALILDQQPDWLIIPEVYARKTLLVNDQFLSEYNRVDTLATDIYGSRGLVIYRRNP